MKRYLTFVVGAVALSYFFLGCETQSHSPKVQELKVGGVYLVDAEGVTATQGGETYQLIKILEVTPEWVVYRTFENFLKTKPMSLDPALDFSNRRIDNLGEASIFSTSFGLPPKDFNETFSGRHLTFMHQDSISDYDKSVIFERQKPS